MRHFSKVLFTIPMVLFMMVDTAEAQRNRLEVRMGANDAVQAKARFEQRNNRMKFNVELEDAQPNATYGIRVLREGRQIDYGFMVTNQFGFSEIDIDNTEGDSVLALQSGDVIEFWFRKTRIMTGALR